MTARDVTRRRIGHAAREQGRRGHCVTTAQLVNELVEAADERQLSRVVGRYGRLDLLSPSALWVTVATTG